LQKSIKLPGKT